MPHREVRAGDIGEGRQDRALADAVEVVLGRWTPPACHVDLHERRQTVVERAMLGAVAGLRLEGPCYDIGEPIGFAVLVERPDVLDAVRSEERRVGEERVSTCRIRWWTTH